MKHKLNNIANLFSGVYLTTDVQPEIYYFQVNHFNKNGEFDKSVKPQISLTERTKKYLLQNDDVLFAAKGLNNFAVVYNIAMGMAVASSSFIIIRINPEFKSSLSPQYLAWYLSNAKDLGLFQKQTGTTISSISIKLLMDFEIVIPSIERQNSILRIMLLHDKEMMLMKTLISLKSRFVKATLLKKLKPTKYEY